MIATRFISLAAVAIPLLAASAQAPVRTLGKALAMSSEPLTRISSIAELPDRRVIVADEEETRLLVLDSSLRVASPLGRRGGGPGEYRALGSLVTHANGVFLADFALRRLLPIGNDLKFGTPVPFPMSLMIGGSDGTGTIYADVFRSLRGPDRSDSMFVIRWNLQAGRIDTLLSYNAAVTGWTGPVGAARKAFPSTDAWTSLPNGDIAVVTAEPYQVHIWRGSARVRSFDIPFRRMRMTKAHQDAFIAKQNAQPVRSLGGGNASPASRPKLEFTFPDWFPPFGDEGVGGRYLNVAGDHLWIERLVPPGSTTRLYDVVDLHRGRMLMQVQMPSASTVAGLGKDVVYVAQLDANEEPVLARYAYPK